MGDDTDVPARTPCRSSLLADAEVSAVPTYAAVADAWKGFFGVTCRASTARNSGSWPRWFSRANSANWNAKPPSRSPTSPAAPASRCSTVDAGGWDDEAVMAEMRRHVAETRADPNAVLVIDGSGFPKKGTPPCAARQPCGRLGKVENCQVGVFLAYVTAKGYAPLDRQLYLPEQWAEDAQRREETHVPETVAFQERWRIGLELLDRSGPDVPFGWVAGDDEFGRASAFRAALRTRGLRYVLDVPSNTSIRDGETTGPRTSAAAVAAGGPVGPCPQPSSRWRRLVVGDGAKGARVVRALETWCRPRARTAVSGRWSGWWSSARWPRNRRSGTRCPMPATQRRRPWRRPTAGGTQSRRCCKQARATSAWATTRCAVGWPYHRHMTLSCQAGVVVFGS